MDSRQGPGGRLAELTPNDCWGLLRLHKIARVAWNGPHGIGIVPVNYTIAESALWFRTFPGSALGRECAGSQVTVEVDHIDLDTHSGWSVVVVGEADVVKAERVPEVLADTRTWPAGNRSLFVRIEPTEITGRKLLRDPGDDRSER
jgi:nitroimidazol reductase NimA-like FMN-containing flavoprotein (pyridoxamine 5'-phosphate oxidase superfamily)